MEKRLTVKFQKLIGRAILPPGTFCEGLRFERKEGDAAARRGTLFALLSLTGPTEFDAPVFGQAIFDTLEEEYFSDLATPPLTALEKAAFSAQRRLLDMTLSAHLSPAVDFNLVLTVSWGWVLYLCRLGGGAIYLLREGRLSEVSLGEESQISCGSGFVYDGDSLILGSQDFGKLFPVAALANSLPKMEEKMQERSGEAVLAALVLKFELVEGPGRQEAIDFVSAAKRPFRRWPALKWRPNLTKRSLLPIFLVILLAVFVYSVFLTISRQSRIRVEKLSQKIFSEVELDFAAAVDLVNLNNADAAELLAKSSRNLKKLEALGFKEPKLAEFQDKVSSLLAKVSKTQVVLAPKLVYDWTLSEKEIKVGNLTGDKENLYTVSRGLGHVYRVSLSRPEESQKVSSQPIENPQAVYVYGPKAFVLGSKGVSTVDLKDGAVRFEDLLGIDFGQVDEFMNYNSNFYFLEKTAGKLIRTLYGEKGYSRPGLWLKEPVNLEKIVSLAIDGSIYLLRADGKLLKFEGGRPVDFNLTGFNKSLGQQTHVYTSAELNSLYLYDSASKLIAQFNKDGIFEKSYDLGLANLDSLTSLYVHPDSLNLYLLAGTKVYEVRP